MMLQVDGTGDTSSEEDEDEEEEYDEDEEEEKDKDGGEDGQVEEVGTGRNQIVKSQTDAEQKLLINGSCNVHRISRKH